ncbi:carbohydrate ABC transporter permease [Dictyobacter arantiisoli]|uniref:Sugar ABC transporter permease n=1 Tax=Dictyobacter arantiisoli TaxID=2014874 RepID=A0A5A5TAR0_9CHLR|nr:carbohydrate ABC transporter permease [Dictyobacter arantiisoli]GCF08571.1 sugar ABC transporter permease [Dictyobacter arantiisoli]
MKIVARPVVVTEVSLPQRRKKSPIKYSHKHIWTRVFLIATSLLFLIPFYWMINTALKTNPELAITPPTVWPQQWAWDNFVRAITTIPFLNYFLNTVVYTVLAALGAVLSNLMVAYGFACIEWRGRNLIFYLVLITIFIPFPIAIIPLFDLFAWLHWINTLLPLVVPTFLGSAFYIFLLRQFLLQIPKELLDAARIDGASEWRILWLVAAPMAKPAIGAVAILAAVGAWNDFMGPLIYLQDDSLHTLSIGLQAFRSTHDIQFNLLMAASILVVIPIVFLFFACQRFFIEGVSLSSIK